MPLAHNGNTYVLTGNSQSLTVGGQPDAMIFVYGSHDVLCDYYTPNATFALMGNYENIAQYGGTPMMTLYGFNATDTLSISCRLTDGHGHPLANGAPLTAASLKSDGHGGWNMPLYGGGNVDFAHVRESTILAAHISVGGR